MPAKIKRITIGPLLTNAYIIESNDEVLVIDPDGGLKKILKEVEGKYLKYIILTHYHLDHTLGAEKFKEVARCKILIHEDEKDFIHLPVDQFLRGGEEIRVGDTLLTIFHLPGHTKGSIAIVGEDFVFVGDTIFEDGVGRTDLPGGSAKDLKNSLRVFSEKFSGREILIYPGHGNPFILNRSQLEKIMSQI